MNCRLRSVADGRPRGRRSRPSLCGLRAVAASRLWRRSSRRPGRRAFVPAQVRWASSATKGFSRRGPLFAATLVKSTTHHLTMAFCGLRDVKRVDQGVLVPVPIDYAVLLLLQPART